MQTIRKRIKSYYVPAIVLILLASAVYGQTIGYDFISNWDDNFYVTHNPDIRGFSAKNILGVFSSVYVGNYAPVQMLSYMLDYQLAGMNPSWFHGVNVVLHTVNGLLFFLLVRRITGKSFWAFVSSAVFLLHPVQVESVAWISQRKNLLAMFFSLCSFIAYVSYRSRTGKESSCAYVLSVLSLLAALLAKPIAVIMPFAYLLYDFCLETPKRGKVALADKIPYLIAVALAACGTLFTQTLEKGAGSFDYFNGNVSDKILTMLPVLTRYLKILIWPNDLNLIYIFIIKKSIDRQALFALLLVLALCIVGVYLARRERRLFFGFAFFFLGLVPVSQIVPLVTLMNDRYLYFPMLGAAWVAGGLLSRVKDRFSGKKFNPAPLLVFCILAPLALASNRRVEVWQNPISLWSDVSRKLPTLKDPRASLAESYLEAGRPQEALRTYEEVFALRRDFSEQAIEMKALSDTADLYVKAGTPDKALPYLTAVTTKFPDYPPGILAWGDYNYRRHDLREAERAYRKALELDALAVKGLDGLGKVCLETGRVDEARELYLKAYKNGGNGPDLQYNLAEVEAVAGGYDQSLRHMEEALRLGYRNRDAIIGNPRLAPIRQLPGFRKIMSDYFTAGK
jgi:protein O-mannosyl-transferase